MLTLCLLPTSCGFGKPGIFTGVVDPTGHELRGLVHQQTFCRELHPPGETRGQRYHRTDRESETWLTAVTAVGRMPNDAGWVHVGDRAADFFGLMATTRATNSHVLIRLVQDRVASSPPDSQGEATGDADRLRLMAETRRVSVTTTQAVAIASRGRRPGRVATLSLGSVRLTIRPPQNEPRWRTSRPRRCCRIATGTSGDGRR